MPSDTEDLDIMSEELLEEDFGFDPTDSDLDLGIRDLSDEEGVEYPALLLSNILFTDVLKVLKELKRDSYRTVDVWLELQDSGDFVQFTPLPLDSRLLIVLRHLKVQATAYWSPQDIEVLDLKDPCVIEKFL